MLLAPSLGLAQSISGFDPGFGAPGEPVSIYGSGFSNPVTVRFNEVISPGAAAATDERIEATVPAGATTGPISVQVGVGQPAYSQNDFVVIGPGPYITGFTPATGAAGTPVTINGVHFTTATAAYFNGKLGVNLYVQSDDTIKVSAPSGVTTGPLSVRSPLGTNTTTAYFYVPPSISGFTPTKGRTGTNVTIRGANFLGAISVTLNGTNASFLVLSNTAIEMAVPPLATTGKVRVNAPGGSFTTTSNFVVLPTIYSFSPGGGPIGSAVVITGANFNVGTPTVRFNGLSATTISNLSFNKVTAVVPANATTGPISITTTAGSDTNPVPFYVSPKITSFTPTNGAPGTRVRITGTSFTGATHVSFGGVPASSFTITNSTTIGATVPVGVATGPITVSSPGGTATSSGLFYGPPAIWSFTPTHGLPNTNVTVFGTNLLGAKFARFNGLNGTSLLATNNGFLTVKVPSGAQAGPISVVTPAGTNTSSTPFILDYVDLVVGIEVTPDYVFSGSNYFYSIIVSNKGPAEAPNVLLTNRFLSGVTLLSAETSQGTIRTNPLPILASLGTLPPSSFAEVELGVVFGGTGTVSTLAGVSSGYLELTPADNFASNGTVVLSPAVLSIQQFTNVVRVAWPKDLSNFVIQSRAGMASTNVWVNVTKGRTNTPTENLLLETNSVPMKIYRLRSP